MKKFHFPYSISERYVNMLHAFNESIAIFIGNSASAQIHLRNVSEWRHKFHRFTSSSALRNNLAVSSLCEKLSRSYFPMTGNFAVNICHLRHVGKARAGYHFSSEIIIYPYLVGSFAHFVKRNFSHFAFSSSVSVFCFLLNHFNRSYRFCLMTTFVQRTVFPLRTYHEHF